MTNEFIHFEKISRKTWQNLHRKTTPPLTQKELNSIKSFNDKISLQDVTDVYLPLTSLIQIYKHSKEDLAFSKGIFFTKSEQAPTIYHRCIWKCRCRKIYYQSALANPFI
mgnify:CR=1 FL=1